VCLTYYATEYFGNRVDQHIYQRQSFFDRAAELTMY
jgi:hypothetical protein